MLPFCLVLTALHPLSSPPPPFPLHSFASRACQASAPHAAVRCVVVHVRSPSQVVHARAPPHTARGTPSPPPIVLLSYMRLLSSCLLLFLPFCRLPLALPHHPFTLISHCVSLPLRPLVTGLNCLGMIICPLFTGQTRQGSSWARLGQIHRSAATGPVSP